MLFEIKNIFVKKLVPFRYGSKTNTVRLGSVGIDKSDSNMIKDWKIAKRNGMMCRRREEKKTGAYKSH